MAKLAGLLSDERWKALIIELGLEPGTDRTAVLHNPKIITDKISATRLLDLVLDEYGAAMSMLADVSTFLEHHGVAPRTTGTIAILPGLEKLRPQQRALLSSWNKAARDRWVKTDAMTALWENARGELQELCDAATELRPPRYRDRLGLGVLLRVDEPHRYHAEIVELIRKHTALIHSALPEINLDRMLLEIQSECQAFVSRCDEIEEGEVSGLILDDDLPTDKITIFVEQLKLLGRLQANKDGLVDLLQISLFRNIPQLFEVWLLCFTLNTLHDVGYPVDLLQTSNTKGENQWKLKFAAAERPIAKIGTTAWVFFQFKAPDKPAMPDLAIYDNATGTGTALLVIDAKYSELQGYTAAHYADTLNKYNTLAKRSIIAEHEARCDLAPHSDILLAVGPGLPGAEKVRAALFGAMTLPSSPALAAIDCSASFSQDRDNALAPFIDWMGNGLLGENYLAFAESAVMETGLKKASATNQWPQMCGSSTRLLPLKEQIAAARAQSMTLTILLISDTEFCDGNREDLRAVCDHLWVFTGQQTR
ncbi:hypothetical protein ACQKI5_26550 [Agrobacterium tumefaciens]|uniref:hypothetical protein n=1 Tax=Agrobacterium tumefaciens TaxID=358 RepID=UPI003CFEFF44